MTKLQFTLYNIMLAWSDQLSFFFLSLFPVLYNATCWGEFIVPGTLCSGTMNVILESLRESFPKNHAEKPTMEPTFK